MRLCRWIALNLSVFPLSKLYRFMLRFYLPIYISLIWLIYFALKGQSHQHWWVCLRIYHLTLGWRPQPSGTSQSHRRCRAGIPSVQACRREDGLHFWEHGSVSTAWQPTMCSLNRWTPAALLQALPLSSGQRTADDRSCPVHIGAGSIAFRCSHLWL